MKVRVLSVVLFWALGLQAGIAAPEQAGNATAVQTETRGILPGQSVARKILLKDAVYRNETVSTDSSGIAQLLFLDNSALTISPNSEVVIDEFVYNPQTGAGSLVARMTKGFLRFVGGRISKQNEVRIETPTATVGIRGGIVALWVSGSGETVVILGFGELSVRTGQGVVSVQRPGFKVTVESADAAPSTPVQASPAEVAATAAPAVIEEAAPAETAATAAPVEDEEAAPAETVSEEASTPEERSAAAPASEETDTAAPAPEETDTAAVPLDEEQVTVALQESGLAEVNSGSGEVAEPAAPVDVVETVATVEDTVGAAEQVGTDAQIEKVVEERVEGLRGRLLLNDPGVDMVESRLTVRGNREDLAITANLVEGGVELVFAEASRREPVRLPGPPDTERGDTNLGGLIRFAVDDVETPFGTVDGYGYAAPDAKFYYYELTVEGRELVAVVGEPPSTTRADRLQSYQLLPSVLLDTRVPFETGPVSSVLVSDLHVLESASPNERSPFMQYSMRIAGEGAAQNSFLSMVSGRILEPGRYSYRDLVPESERFRRRDEELGRMFNMPALVGFRRGSARRSSTGALIVSDGTIGELIEPLGVTSFGGSEYRVLGPGTAAASLHGWGTFLDRRFETSPERDSKALVDDQVFWHRWYVARSSSPSVAESELDRNLGVLIASSAGLNDLDYRDGGLPGIFQGVGSLEFDPGGSRVRYSVPKEFAEANPRFDVHYAEEYSAYIDDDRYALITVQDEDYLNDEDDALHFYLVGDVGAIFRDGSAAEQEALSGLGLPADEYCRCEFLEWGFWGGEWTGPERGDFSAGFNMGTWVAGVVPASADLPTSGEATYMGHAVGDVARRESTMVHRYLAAGNFEMAWNFATRAGTASIDNFDGRSFSGNVGPDTRIDPANAALFGGDLTGTGVTGTMQGGFLSNAMDAAAGVGGRWSVSGDDYRVAGTFAGER